MLMMFNINKVTVGGPLIKKMNPCDIYKGASEGRMMGGYQTVTGFGECTGVRQGGCRWSAVFFTTRRGWPRAYSIHPCPNGCVETQAREYWNESGGDGEIYFERVPKLFRIMTMIWISMRERRPRSNEFYDRV